MGCAGSTKVKAEQQPPDEGRFAQKKQPAEEAARLGFYDKYMLGQKIGRGAFAQVHLATRVDREIDGQRHSGRAPLRAVKILDVRSSKGAHLQRAARMEATIWNYVGHHDNCIHLYDVFFTPELSFMVMERCCSGLLTHLEQLPEVTERAFGKIFLQMLTAIAHCHSVGVVHRDVKPANFLVGGQDGKTVKLGDFGLSAMMPAAGKLNGINGTAPYMCPEMLAGRWCSEKADVWSFGVIVYVLLFGTFPYQPQAKTAKSMKQAILEGATIQFKPDPTIRTTASNMRSEHAGNFVKNLLIRDPYSRPSAIGASKMPYMLAVTNDCHMLGTELPSLRSMVQSAKQEGAFEIRNGRRHSHVDVLLNELQASSFAPRKSQKSCVAEAWEPSSNASTAIPSTSDTLRSVASSPSSRHGAYPLTIRSAWGTSDNSDFAY